MAIVYKITNNLTGKSYIGATVTKLNERWNRHTSDAMTEKDGQAIHAAIRKYGVENFTIEIIEEHPDDKYVFEVLEPKYIQEYKTYGNDGYNMTLGGDGWLGMKHSQETKDKISKAHKGRKHTDEARKNMSEAHKGKVPWNKGKECPQISKAKSGVGHTEESKKIFSECHKGMKHKKETKNIMKTKMAQQHLIQNMTTGEIISVVNLAQFCKNNSMSHGNLIALGHTKGFKILKTTKTVRTYVIENTETKETHTTQNLKQFCNSVNISNSGLLSKYKVDKPYMNWKIVNIEYTKEEKVY